MKIDRTTPASSAERPPRLAPPATRPTVPGLAAEARPLVVVGHARLAALADELESTLRAVESAPDLRHDLLASLTARADAGTLYGSPDEIAAAMLGWAR
jgi:hypothetical protein